MDKLFVSWPAAAVVIALSAIIIIFRKQLAFLITLTKSLGENGFQTLEDRLETILDPDYDEK